MTGYMIFTSELSFMVRYIKSSSTPKTKYKYTFSNGDVVYSDLAKGELMKRMNRLDTLRILVEGHEGGEYLKIYNKAYRALHANPFTGILHLTFDEKDALGYKMEQLDSKSLSDDEIATICFYTGNTKPEQWGVYEDDVRQALNRYKSKR